MNPAASPARPGVRRVNNVPVAILGAAVAIFLGIMAYVAAGRASQGRASVEERAVRSSRTLAQSVAGDAEAGLVPASSPASTAPAQGSLIQPGSRGGKGNHLPPPPPPPPRLGDKSDALLPPRSSEGAAPPMGAHGPSAALAEVSDAERDIAQMQLEMFKQAVRAKTTTVMNEGGEQRGVPADGPQGLGDVRAELAAAQARSGAGSYVEKLRELQESGLVPAPDAAHSGSDKAGGDAYVQFAGKKEQDRWALGERLEAPESAYELRAGAVIPATLQTGINSDLPGQITAIVAQDVRDTPRGKYVLIPQGSRLVGTYGSDVKYGQERVLVAWQRIVWPDGKALDIGAMPGSDGAGYAGFNDQANTHFWRLVASSLLLSGITGGIALSQDSVTDKNGRTNFSGAMSQALGQEFGQVTQEMIRKQMNVAPTIEIRPGYRFNVQVTKDLTFNGPYKAFDYQRSIAAGAQTFRTPAE
jgi:type IV secretory pathway VirB10-like protein